MVAMPLAPKISQLRIEGSTSAPPAGPAIVRASGTRQRFGSCRHQAREGICRLVISYGRRGEQHRSFAGGYGHFPGRQREEGR